jgi:hypothetical protein
MPHQTNEHDATDELFIRRIIRQLEHQDPETIARFFRVISAILLEKIQAETSKLQALESQYKILLTEDKQTPGKHALRLNALGEEIAVLRSQIQRARTARSGG